MNNELKSLIDSKLGALADNIERKAIKIVDEEHIVAWGRLRRSIKTKYNPQALTIDVFADAAIAPYAQYVHEGRKAGRMPPVSAIEEWARKKRLLSNRSSLKLPVRLSTKSKLSSAQEALAKQYHSTAWAVAMKMKQKEIKPKRFLVEAILEGLKEFER